MRTPKPGLVICFGMLIAFSSLAVAQEELDNNHAQAAAMAANRALIHQQRVSVDSDQPAKPKRECCGDTACCAACQASAKWQDESQPDVRGCDRCRVFVQANTEEEAAQVAAGCGEDCPYCHGSGNSFSRPGINVPNTNTPTGDCDCAECQKMFGHLPTTPPLPGQVAFLRENAIGLAEERDRLADELTVYITAQPRDPAHLREVLRLCLETAAQDAHAAAMDSTGVLQVTTPAQADLSQLEIELAETRRMMLATRRDVQLMNESLQFLARHLKQQTATTSPEQQLANAVPWQSQPTKLAPAVINELDTVGLLKEQVRELENRLQQADRAAVPPRVSPAGRPEQQLASSWGAEGQLMPANWEREPLRPKSQTETPLLPAASLAAEPLVWRHYYVGDLISPPVATTTFRLMQHIKSKIEPDSWKPESIQIASPSVSLLVLQSPENHRRLETLLTEMGATMLR